jgi:O-acetylhomoserine (thiol)-lyase
MDFNTTLLHGKAVKPYPNGSTLPPITQVSAFSYETSEQLEKVFNNRAPGYAYTRISNPVVAAFEQRVCELEQGIGAVACSSGMSAVTMSLLNILEAGDEIIAGSGLFGGTIDLFEDLEAFGIRTKFVNHISKDSIAPLINEKTKVVFGEVIGNPALDVMDIREVADFLHSEGIPLIVDATTATSYLVQPLNLGADVVVHSSSKYINGSGDAISGIIVDSGRFHWDAKRYPGMASYVKYGPNAYLAKLRNGIWRNMGGCLAPMNAYLNVLGMETLGLRMERICNNAKQLAEALEQMEGVTVNYPTLESNPYHELVQEQFGGLGGGILTVGAGSKERAYQLMDALKYAHKATNIGDLRTLVIHPASTIYIHSSEKQKEAAGVAEDTIRVSVGIENIEDLIADFREAIQSLK